MCLNGKPPIISGVLFFALLGTLGCNPTPAPAPIPAPKAQTTNPTVMPSPEETPVTAPATAPVPQPSAATEEEEGLPPISPDIVYAVGWKSLELDANGATTLADSSGHYSTDRNMCQRPGDGAYDLGTWNTLSKALNQIVTTPNLSTPRCIDSPEGSKFYNRGIAQLVLPNGEKRKLLEYVNVQICSTISDPALSTQFIELVEKTVFLADRADALECPNYRP
ncbi:hypothetical protein WDW37_06125 [Bdellovibrionota bacterium FG-1]